MDGNELYMVSTVNTTDHESRVIVVDLGKNSLKEFSPFPTKRLDLFEEPYIACDLFKYMNMPSDETETGWDDAYLSVSSTLEPIEESGVIKLTRPSNHYPSPAITPCSLELISPDYQSWNNVFLSQRNNISRLISRRNHQQNRAIYICSTIPCGTVSCFCMNQLQLSSE